MGKKVALHNLGCKVNAYEVEAMQHDRPVPWVEDDSLNFIYL